MFLGNTFYGHHFWCHLCHCVICVIMSFVSLCPRIGTQESFSKKILGLKKIQVKKIGLKKILVREGCKKKKKNCELFPNWPRPPPLEMWTFWRWFLSTNFPSYFIIFILKKSNLIDIIPNWCVFRPVKPSTTGCFLLLVPPKFG